MRTSAGKQRRKKKMGLMGCLGRLLFLIILFALVGILALRAFEALGANQYLKQLRYPIRYEETVKAAATEFGLDQSLVYAVIRTESRFDPYAVSETGAKGLMQLQEETAQECARALKIQNYDDSQLFDPSLNIRLGCYYLKKLIRNYHGKVETAVAAYNGGPGNVDRWLADPRYCLEEDVLSEIPFPETKGYVEKVMTASHAYQEIYLLDERSAMKHGN